ncbi:MAG: hypothetical protein ACRDKA_02125 [Actinomycetota bacterium]
MADLRELLSQADRVPAPDLWPDIRERRPRRPDRSRRVAAGAVALALATSGVVLVTRAFLGDREGSPGPREAGMEVDPRITAEVPVGDFPQEIAVGEGAVWVTVNQTEPSVRWFVARIDPATNQVTDEIDVPGAGDVAVGEGAVWVAGHPARDPEVDPALYRIDPVSRQVVAEVTLPCAPYCGANQVAVGDGAVWVTLGTNYPDSGEVVRVDPRSNEIAARIEVSGDPRDLVVEDGSVWVFGLGRGGALHRIDPQTNELAATLLQGRIYSTSGVDSPPILATGFGYVWIGVGDGDPMEVARIDPRTNEIAGEPVRLGLDEALFQPFSTEAGGVWFRGGQQGNQPLIGRLNPITLTVDETLRLDGTVVIDGTIDPGTGTMWLTNLRRIVTRVDLQPAREQSIPADDQSDSTGAAAAPVPQLADVLRLTRPEEGLLGAEIAVGEGSLWVPLHGPHGSGDRASILRIDPTANEVVAEIPVPGGPADLTVGAGSVWVVGYAEGGHVVSRIDPTANRVVSTVPLPEGTSGGPIVATDDAVWVGATGDTTAELLRLDRRTGQVLDRVAAHFCNPFSGRCSPNDELVIGEGALWAAGRRQGTLLRLDLSTHEVTTIPADNWNGLAVGDGAVWVARVSPGDEEDRYYGGSAAVGPDRRRHRPGGR